MFSAVYSRSVSTADTDTEQGQGVKRTPRKFSVSVLR